MRDSQCVWYNFDQKIFFKKVFVCKFQISISVWRTLGLESRVKVLHKRLVTLLPPALMQASHIPHFGTQAAEAQWVGTWLFPLPLSLSNPTHERHEYEMRFLPLLLFLLLASSDLFFAKRIPPTFIISRTRLFREKTDNTHSHFGKKIKKEPRRRRELLTYAFTRCICAVYWGREYFLPHFKEPCSTKKVGGILRRYKGTCSSPFLLLLSLSLVFCPIRSTPIFSGQALLIRHANNLEK